MSDFVRSAFESTAIRALTISQCMLILIAAVLMCRLGAYARTVIPRKPHRRFAHPPWPIDRFLDPSSYEPRGRRILPWATTSLALAVANWVVLLAFFFA